jgi:hypothetical protein
MLQARRAGPLGGRAPLAALLTLLLALAPSSVDGDWRATAEADKAAAAVVTSRAWGAMQHRVGSLVLEGRRVSDVLGPVLKHNFTLPPAQLAKALVYTGANFRLRRTVHDLVTARRPVRVGAVGGSITHGAKSSQPGKTDWFSLVGAYLRTAFPHAEISMRNGALPATPSALMNMCLEQYVDADVDLIFVEYVANDGSNRCGAGMAALCVCVCVHARACASAYLAARAPGMLLAPCGTACHYRLPWGWLVRAHPDMHVRSYPSTGLMR